MAKIGRNDACPCGSGRKYKNCHLGVPVPAPGAPGAGEPPPPPGKARVAILVPILALALFFGVLGAVWRGGEGLAVGVALGALAGLGLHYMRSAPPPTGRGGGSSINFGR